MLALYYKPGYCSDVVYLVLEELGLPYEKHLVLFEEGNQNYQTLRKINVKGAVPTLVEDAFVLTEATAIMRYLVESNENWDLYPKPGTKKRARCDEWLSFFSTFFQAQFWTLYVPHHFVESKAAQLEVSKVGLEKLKSFFEAAEARIEEGSNYLLGDQFTIADCYVFMIQSWAYDRQVDLSAYPKFQRLVENIYERPSAKKVLAEIEDFYKETA